MKKIYFLITFFTFSIVYSQELNLEGKVIENETDLPLAGATIQIVGSESGVVSDFDGNFNIKVKIGETLKISYIGMKSVEIPVLTSPIQVSMETDINQLDEVTVSVGYFDISEKDLSGSITQITSDQIEKNRSNSVESLLQGQVSGLVVSESSEPGGGSGISIRGTNSILGGTQPLYVLDGIPVDPLTDADGMGGSGEAQSSLSFINPNDIEKIEVLTKFYNTKIAELVKKEVPEEK